MATINEEFIAEYSRVIGNAYSAIVQGFGSETTPGSALFALNQLKYLAETKIPAFGIIQQSNDTTGFNVTIDPDDASFLKISSGQVSYFNNILSVSSQRLSIVKNFGNPSLYSSNEVYGMRIGFPITEAEKLVDQIYSSVLSQNFIAFSKEVYIENPQRIIELGFPITAYIGTNTYVVFDKATSDNKGLVIDQAITINKSFDKGTSLKFIYEPKVKSLFGLPVPVTSHDPATFTYYPLLPSDWLHIADVLILNPQSPVVDTFGTSPAILRKAIDFPATNIQPPLFSQADALQILKNADAAIKEIESNNDKASIDDAISALEYYTSALQESTGKTFRQFWASRPLDRIYYLNKGITYEGLSRFEFSDNFADAYFALRQQDLNRTFAMFRGDLYSNPTTLYGDPPGALTLSSHYDFKGIKSSITNGTYYYGVSAVVSSGETRETPTKFSSLITNPNENNYLNEIQWSPVQNALFYHIYRKSTQSGQQIEYRLTSVNSVKGAGPFTQTPVEENDQVNLTTNGIAFRIQPGGPSSLHLGGILFKLKSTSASITNLDAFVTVQLYNNYIDPNPLVDGSKPFTEITTAIFENISFEEIIRDNNGQLTTNFKDIILKTNFTLNESLDYWIVLTLSQAPSEGNIQLSVSNANATKQFATFANSNWTTVNNITAYYKLLGFIDNAISGTTAATKGLFLTKKISKEPRRLRIFIPDVEKHPTMSDVSFGSNANIVETKITKNEMIVTIIAQNGTDNPVTLPSITIPQFTPVNTEILVGTNNQIFDRVLDVQVTPGANLSSAAINSILWSKYDLFVVENVP